MTPEKIARINELAKKQKAGTLTDAEKEEQAALRLEYRQSVVGNLRQQLNNVEFVEPDGKKTKPCHSKKKKSESLLTKPSFMWYNGHQGSKLFAFSVTNFFCIGILGNHVIWLFLYLTYVQFAFSFGTVQKFLRLR